LSTVPYSPHVRRLIASVSTEFIKYGLASAAALAADMLVFSSLMRLAGLGHGPAATFGFVAGVAVAYAISVTWVFSQRSFGQHPALEFLTFIMIGLAGLGITHSVLWLGVDRLQLVPEFVKLVAAGATFVFNFVVRKFMLFRAGASVAPAFAQTRN